VKTPRVHFHTDNDAFAGCEQMLVVLVGEAVRTREIRPSLSFRASERYNSGLAERMPYDIDRVGLALPDPEGLAKWTKAKFPTRSGKPIRGLVRLIMFTLPIRQLIQIYDVAVLTKLFSKLRPDIVHINNGGFPGAASCTAAAIAAGIAGVDCVVYVVNSQAHGYTTLQRWYEFPLERLCTRFVTRFVTASKAAASRLAEVLRLPPGKAVAIPNGIAERAADESPAQTRVRLGVEPDHVLILCVGSLEKGKGHRYAIEAFSRLCMTNPEIKTTLLIVGIGPEQQHLERLIDEIAPPGRARILPLERNIWNLYAASDIVVLPSILYEDFPNVVLEAMANSKPVIASAISGIPEQVIDGETGLLVPPRDVDALQKAMERLTRSKELRERLGKAGKQRFEAEFTASKAARRYFDLYRELLETTAGD